MYMFVCFLGESYIGGEDHSDKDRRESDSLF